MKLKKEFKIFIIAILLIAIIALIICFTKKDDEKVKPENDELSMTIVNSGWSFVEADTGNYISYGVELSNNSISKLVKEPSLIVVGKDKDGKELFNIEENITYLSPSQKTYFGKTFNTEEKPDKVEFSLKVDTNNFIDTKDLTYLAKDEIIISEIKETKENEIIHYTGNIENKSSNEISQLLISIIFKKDNKIVGGSYSYINAISGNKTTSFKIDAMNIPEYDTYEINYISGDNLN